MDNLHGKVAVITGASYGLGAEVARRLAAHGCCLVLVGRYRKPLGRVARQCVSGGLQGSQILPFVCSEFTRESMEKVVRAARLNFGFVHILVNNAPNGEYRDHTRDPDADYSALMAASVDLTTRLACPLRRHAGSVINIAVHIKSAPSAKCVMTETTKCLAERYEGVFRVNSIVPDVASKPLFLKDPQEQQEIERVWGLISETTGISDTQNCSTQQVAEIVAFLASSEATDVHGLNLPIEWAQSRD